MTIKHRCNLVLASLVSATMLASSSAAWAVPCFTAFGGSGHFQFAGTLADFKASGARSVAGSVFGSFTACAGLTHWPLVGTEIATPSAIVLAFRAMTVDAASCGAVDYIVNLDPTTLNGTLQLHNDRNNFSNTTAMTYGPCVVQPLVAARSRTAAAPDGQHVDPTGNTLK